MNISNIQEEKYCSSYIKDYYEDLFESGIIGILEALENFDPERDRCKQIRASVFFDFVYNE